MRRYDYAVFADDAYVTNALLTVAEAKRMESEGYRCLRVRDTLDAFELPRFRGKGYVRSRYRSGRWWADR